jgi:hypothetical protein
MSVLLYLGACYFFLHGSALLYVQVETWLKEGRWIKLPATYLFEPPIVPRTPEDVAFYVANGLPVQPALKKTLTKQADIMAEIRALRSVSSLLPSRWREPWLSEPKSWLGLHKIVRYFLKDTSIPFLFFCCGLALLLWGFAIENNLEPVPGGKPKGS